MEMEPIEAAALPVPPPPVKAVEATERPVEQDETRTAEDAVETEEAVGPPPAPVEVVKESRWKLAFRQLMFMKTMNMQVNDRNKNEIELRQHNITPLSLMCSVPYFNTLSSSQIQALVEASQPAQLRPGETLSLVPRGELCDKYFYIVSSGTLAIASADVDNARAIQQANLSPKFKLGVGDCFAVHQVAKLRVIAMEPVEYLVLRMDVIASISETAEREIEADQCVMGSESAETASFKHWALQYTQATQRPAPSESHSPSKVPKGLAKCTLKQFSKDFLLHFSPENELDHTLEYMKLTLMSVFKARRVRMFIIDSESKKLLIKFSDDQLSQGTFELEGSIAEKVIEKRGAVYVPAMTPYLEVSEPAGELYKPTDRVVAAPVFEFDPIGASNEAGVAPILAVLEVVMHSALPDDGTSLVQASATENDMQILEIAAQELSRYLFFHYEDFFAIALKSEADDKQADPTTEVFPAPDASGSEEKLSLTLHELSVSAGDALASHAVVSIYHGKMALTSKNVPVRPGSPMKDKMAPRSYLFDGSVDLEIPLGDIPHGSHLLIQVFTKKGLVAWSGTHLFDFGHGLRTGTLELDISKPLEACVTSLDIENCAKTHRPNKINVIGSLRLSLECTGAAQGFSFSSLAHKPKRSITYRASIFGEKRGSNVGRDAQAGVEHQSEQLILLNRLRGDPLVQLSPDDCKFVWDSRHSLLDDSALLPAFLLSVNWSKRDQVMEAYRMLILWRQPTYLQALQLLSPMFPDPKVRAYAVRCMHSLPDHRLRLYLLQLVQALKNERYHDSALARFLIMRALQNPAEIGYSLYWFLRAEVHVDQTSERFGLIMEEYMQLCGSYKLEIRQSVFVMKKLEEIALVVKTEPTKAARRARLHEELRATVLPETFQLPLHPRAYSNGIIVEPCRVMESKKRPLFLQLESAKAQHGNPFVIFKSGDDLRQDQLVLQILRVMDDLWREAGLDLCLSPYACISTGNELGLIEVVGDSSTLATIIYDRHQGSWTKLSRKLKSAKDALVGSHVISEWLFAEENEEKATDGNLPVADDAADERRDLSAPSSPTDMPSPMGSPTKRPASKSSAAEDIAEKAATPTGCFPPLSPSKLLRSPKKSFSRDEDATQNFLRSCAGYCVATYVLGIGDRHNDNIMLQRSGKFFHIDFGHFLGNFKSKFGIKREKAPFVLTPAMINVIDVEGSGNLDKFRDIACDAFRILRANSNLLITLLVLALTCGTPELTCEDDIRWVHNTLMLELSDEDACKKFRKLIDVALHTKTTRVNDAVHLMAH